MPPATDQKATQQPSRKTRLRSASIMGSTITSAGMGKKLASAKANSATAAQAWRPLALASIQA